MSCNAPGKAPNERVLGHETFGPLIQLTEGLQPPSFSWLLFPFQPCTQETELQFKPKDHKSSCKCNSSHHCQMVQKRRRRRFLSTTDNTFKCMMLFFISRLHYRTWIHNCPVFSILSQLSSLNSRICCVQNWLQGMCVQPGIELNKRNSNRISPFLVSWNAFNMLLKLIALLLETQQVLWGGARTLSQLSCHKACTFWNLVAAAKQKLYKNHCRYGARQTWISKAWAISSSGVRGGREPAMLDHDEADAPVSSPSSSVFSSFSRSFFLLFFCFPKRQEENKVVDVLLLQT